MTIIPWFTTDVADEEVEKAFRQRFNNLPKVSLNLTENVMFGSHKDIGVTLVETNESLLKLHRESLSFFDQLGAHWAVKNPYVDHEYRPHIRRRLGSKIEPGQSFELDTLTLVKARRQEDEVRVVAAQVGLKDKEEL